MKYETLHSRISSGSPEPLYLRFFRCRRLLAVFLFLIAAEALSVTTVYAQSDPQPATRAVTTDKSAQTSTAVVSSQQSKPQWEFGLAGGASYGFDYPASNDENRRAIALPFFIYRTPLFRFGGGGVRAVAIEKPRLKLDLSVGGSLNASSDGNSVREGMPDLDFLFEVGPQLELRLFERHLPTGERLLGKFSSELRAVFATDFSSVSAQGIVAEVGVGVSLRNIRQSGIDLFSAVDVTFANERLQDYFYEVDPQFVTQDRPLFDAKGGYLETDWFVGLGFRPLPRVRVFVGMIKGYYDGARNQGSPLFETTVQTRYALGVVWTIKASETMIDVVDMGTRQ